MILGKGSKDGNAQVKVFLEMDDRVLAETYADPEGKFSFLLLKEGDYQVTIQSPGYRTYLHPVALRFPSHQEERFVAYLTPLSGPSAEENREARWRAAFADPELFRQITPVVEIEATGEQVLVFMGAPASEISFRSQEQEFHAEILFMGQVYGEDGKALFKELPINRGFRVNLTHQQFLEIAAQDMAARSQLQLHPGKYKLVLLVEDAMAGTLGTAVREFFVP